MTLAAVTGSLAFARDGALQLPSAARDVVPDLLGALAHLPRDRAGVRLHGIAALQPHLAPEGGIGGAGAALLGPACRPVRAILFDKSPGANWSLGWHQDRTICVERRIETEGFGAWTVKQGMVHVAPPFEILGQMVTARVHLDDVPATNAPLLIAPGSHRLGRIAESDIEAVIGRCGTYRCLAKVGDIWLYATPILHASHAAVSGLNRRVLQVDFAAIDLPGELRWQGV